LRLSSVGNILDCRLEIFSEAATDTTGAGITMQAMAGTADRPEWLMGLLQLRRHNFPTKSSAPPLIGDILATHPYQYAADHCHMKNPSLGSSTLSHLVPVLHIYR